MIRTLLVEDDPIQLAVTRAWLEEHGHTVHGETRGEAALRALQRESFDLVILDWMLPDTSGEELLAWIRGRESRVPVLFATAKDEEDEIADMLLAGADDYVVKPLRQREFVARIDALARRAGLLDDAHRPLELGPYRVDVAARKVCLDGTPVKMTPRMAEVAVMLFRRVGNLVSRAQLYEQIWGLRAELDTRTVDTHVSRVRHALQLDGRHGWRLSSVYQHGYRIEKSAA